MVEGGAGNCSSYKYDQGNHKKCCGGLCLYAGCNVGSLNMIWVSLLLIAGPMGLWYGLLWSATHRSFSDGAWPIFILLSGCCYLSLYYLFRAHFTEPGILTGIRISKGHGSKHFKVLSHHDASEHPDTAESGAVEFFEEDMTQLGPTEEVALRAISPTGSFKKEPLRLYRAKYCSETRNIIENFDHFCPWIGNAVGIRNYYYFYNFTFWTVLLAVLVGLSSATTAFYPDHLCDEGNFFGGGDCAYRIAGIVLAVFCVIILFVVGPLCCYHSNMVCFLGLTTNERLKNEGDGTILEKYRRRGCCNNWCHFFKTGCCEIRATAVIDTPSIEMLNNLLPPKNLSQQRNVSSKGSYASSYDQVHVNQVHVGS